MVIASGRRRHFPPTKFSPDRPADHPPGERRGTGRIMGRLIWLARRIAVGNRYSPVMTRALVGAAVGVVGGAVYGILCGALWGVLRDEMGLVLALGIRCAAAGAAAGALVGGFGRIFGGDNTWSQEDGEGNS